MNYPCIINLSPDWEIDLHGTEREARTLRPWRQPKYVHDDLESAQTEALRLHKTHAGPAGRFVIFQAVEQTEWHSPFEIAAATVGVLAPYDSHLPVQIPERSRKRKKKTKP